MGRVGSAVEAAQRLLPGPCARKGRTERTWVGSKEGSPHSAVPLVTSPTSWTHGSSLSDDECVKCQLLLPDL